MSNPQQPELARTRLGATDQGSAKANVDTPPAVTGPEGPIPEDNAPGHHPDVEQDKPTGPPPRPKRAASKAAERKGAKARAAKAGGAGKAAAAAAKKAPGKKTTGRKTGTKATATGAAEQPRQDVGTPDLSLAAEASSTTSSDSSPAATPVTPAATAPAAGQTTSGPTTAPSPLRSGGPAKDPVPGRLRFAFAFEPRLVPLGAVFGVLPFTTGVEVTADELRVRFGPWSLITPLSNVTGAEVTGPYQVWKVAGPSRLSLADGGITFATNTRAGACLTFRHPVPAALPLGILRHPSVTVTVAEPQALIDAIRQRVDI